MKLRLLVSQLHEMKRNFKNKVSFYTLLQIFRSSNFLDWIEIERCYCASKHTCELPQRKCKRKRKRQRKKWKIFHFLALASALTFSLYTCEPGQRKRKCKMKNTRFMPLRFTFKPRWRPPLPSLISFPASSFPDCWSRVIRTLGTRLPPSWDTEMRVRISFCLRLRSTCERRLRLLLRLRGKCEPALNS